LGVWGMVAGLVVGILILDFGAQSAQVSNQHIIQALRPEMRSRLNAILMGGMFIGGAAGSGSAMLAWQAYGWSGVSALGITLAVIALAVQSWRRASVEQAMQDSGGALLVAAAPRRHPGFERIAIAFP